MNNNRINRNRQPKEKPIPGIDQPLTPEECKQAAASLPDHPYVLSPEELEMIQEEVHGKPLKHGDAETAITAMQRRLELLAQQKADSLAALEDCDPSDEQLRNTLVQGLNELNKQIALTKERLDAYRFQRGQSN